MKINSVTPLDMITEVTYASSINPFVQVFMAAFSEIVSPLYPGSSVKVG